MRERRTRSWLMSAWRCTAWTLVLLLRPAFAGADGADDPGVAEPALRIAVFNTALSQDQPAALAGALGDPSAPKPHDGLTAHLAAIAEVLAHVRPTVVVLLEVDADAAPHLAAGLTRHLPEGAGDVSVLREPGVYVPEVNTGVPSGQDLDRDGAVGGPGDAYGWGKYPGHYGMVVLAAPGATIDHANVRTFRTMKWIDLTGHVMPVDWFGDAAPHVRLSSKTHADLPILVTDAEGNAHRLHLLISHPTPPVFDGPEDRNGRRNHDEITLWGRYLDGVALTDDAGVTAALEADAAVVVLGDLNADPHDGDSFGEALPRLLAHPRLAGDVKPSSEGARQASTTQGQINAQHDGPAELDTADFPDAPPRGPGNLRVDYVLPPAARTGWRVLDAGVFWPAEGQPGAEAARVSDHRLVWVDLAPPGAQ